MFFSRMMISLMILFRQYHMDITVGIRRAIMQNKARQIRVMFDHFFVDVVFLPILQHFGSFFGSPARISKGVAILWMVSL